MYNQHNQLWQGVLDQLQFQMTKAIFITWLKNTQLINVVGQRYTIAVESMRAKEWLEHRLKRTVARALAQVVGEDNVQVDFVVRNSQSESPEMGK
jgi:chromosomal replication initiation ATPase DnaA